jgi:hypothetical protein
MNRKCVSHGAPLYLRFSASRHSPSQRHGAKVGQETGVERYFLGPILSLEAMVRATPVWTSLTEFAGSIKGAGMRIPIMDRQRSAGTLRVNAREAEDSEEMFGLTRSGHV